MTNWNYAYAGVGPGRGWPALCCPAAADPKITARYSSQCTGFKTFTVIGLSLWRTDIIAAGGGLDRGLDCFKSAAGNDNSFIA